MLGARQNKPGIPFVFERMPGFMFSILSFYCCFLSFRPTTSAAVPENKSAASGTIGSESPVLGDDVVLVFFPEVVVVLVLVLLLLLLLLLVLELVIEQI